MVLHTTKKEDKKLFIDIDYGKKPQVARLYLAKPNKQIISHISEKFRDGLALKLGNINELNFTIPHFIEDADSGTQIPNPHVEMIKERMLIQVKLNTYLEWFIIDSIEEEGADSDEFTVTAFSLGYELNGKEVNGFVTESMNAKEMADEFLAETIWKVKEIDPLFNQMYRSFESGEDSNVLNCLTEWATTFGGLLVWHSDTREVSLLDMTKNGTFKGLTIDYGKYLHSIKRSRTVEKMPTRLYVYGSEGMTIHASNPTGMGYIEDFSHYMYPFERDANRVVLKKSHYMTDELCHAILDHKAILANNTPMIQDISGHLSKKIAEKAMKDLDLSELALEMETILQLLDLAQATGDTILINQRKNERDAKQVQMNAVGSVIGVLQGEINALNKQLDELQKDISNQANFTPSLLEELNLYIYTATFRDDRYIDAKELYEDGLKHFNEIRQPKVVIEVTIENLLNIIEEQYYWDKLVLGELVKIKYPQMNIEYMAKIIEINYDLEAGEATLVIANTQDLLSDMEKFTQLLYSSQSASTLIQNNKYKWEKINALEEEVSALMTSTWNANKNKIIAGVNNTIEIGNRGIIVQNPKFPKEILIMQSGIIALSKDGGETWKTAITPDGIVAERLIGQVIAGEELMITNSSGSFTLDANGAIFDVDSFIIRSRTGGGNLVERWEEGTDFVDAYRDDNLITPYEKKMLMREWDEILSRYIANSNKIINYFENEGTDKQFVIDYHNRYEELFDYLFTKLHGEKALLADNNLEFTTKVISQDFNGFFRNYDVALVNLEEQLSIRAVDLSREAIESAKQAQTNIDEVMDDIVWKIELHSSNGLTFKNNIVNTVITARVYRGKDDITATLNKNSFIWKKFNKNGDENLAWGVSKKGIGNTIQVTEKDVQEKATFNCDVSIV